MKTITTSKGRKISFTPIKRDGVVIGEISDLARDGGFTVWTIPGYQVKTFRSWDAGVKWLERKIQPPQ